MWIQGVNNVNGAGYLRILPFSLVSIIFPLLKTYIVSPTTDSMGQDTVVDTATGYGLDDPGIESWWG
jgi:hypothetical protein